MWVYLYRDLDIFTLFWFAGQSDMSANSIHLCATLVRDASINKYNVYMVYEESGTHFGRKSSAIDSVIGWQFFAFEYAGTDLRNSSTDLFAFSYFDSSDVFRRTHTGNDYGNFPDYASYHTNIGSLTKNGTDYSNILEGMISQFNIFQRDTEVGAGWVPTYTSFVKNLGGSYDYNWIMTDTSNNFFGSNAPYHICSYWYNGISNNIVPSTNFSLPIIHNQGWASTDNETTIYTSLFSMEGINHWTVEAEVFLTSIWYDIDLKMFEGDSSAPKTLHSKFSFWIVDLADPWTIFNISLNAYTFNRLYMSMSPDGDDYEFCLSAQLLHRDNESEHTLQHECININTTYEFNDTNYRASIGGYGFILSDMKIYRYMMTNETIIRNTYSDSSPYSKYSFSETFYSNYWQK